MNARIANLKKGLTIVGFLLLPSVADAQVMWNLKGSWMNRQVYLDHYDDGDELTKHTRPDWTVGLELEIPLSEKLNLETGLRWKNHNVFINKEYEFEAYGKPYTVNKTFGARQLAEIPLRLTYKQQLGRNSSLHLGIGPYASYILDGGWEYYENENTYSKSSRDAEWRDSKWNENLHVGLEPSVVINWACLSLGATYNIPCFYKGYKDENKPIIMATLGIRFKSSAWKYVGATLLTIATVGGAAASAWSSAVEANQNYSSGSYGSSSYSSGSNSSSGGNYETMYRKWEKQAQNAYNSLAGHSGGTVTYQKNKQLLRDAQNEMKKWREKARKAGIMIPQSEWETKTVSIY